MRTLIVLLIVVVIAAGALYALGVFQGEAENDHQTPAAPTGTGGDGDTEPAPPTLANPPPKERPEIQRYEFQKPTKVLLLVGVPQTFNAFLAQHWSAARNVEVVTWAAPLPRPAGNRVPARDSLPGSLSQPPKAITLDDEDIDVVVLHDLDPKALEDDFWIEVAKRVEDGRLGLLAIPELALHGLAMFEHPIVGPLLPVTKVKPVAGQPVPGMFGTQVPFRVTEEGKRHPASRLVPWPKWSGILWDATRHLKTPWGTKFAWPVEEAAEGAQVLLRADPEHGDSWPVLIAGSEKKGRVLWYGAPDLGSFAAHGRPYVVKDWDALVRAWLAWLTGEVTE